MLVHNISNDTRDLITRTRTAGFQELHEATLQKEQKETIFSTCIRCERNTGVAMKIREDIGNKRALNVWSVFTRAVPEEFQTERDVVDLPRNRMGLLKFALGNELRMFMDKEAHVACATRFRSEERAEEEIEADRTVPTMAQEENAVLEKVNSQDGMRLLY
jgi:hypothetical protein